MRLLQLAACLAAWHVAASAAGTARELLDSVLNPDPASATFASYGSAIYYNATLYNQTVDFSTNYFKLEASAKHKLPPDAYDYAAGGAGLEKTVEANLAAFNKVCASLSSSLLTVKEA